MTAAKYVTVAALGGTYRIEGKTYGPSDGPVRIPGHLAAALGLAEYDAEAEAAAEQTVMEGTDLQADLDRLNGLLDRTAAAVLARQDFLKVPRSTEASPAGQDLAEAVATGFDDLKAELDQAQAQIQELQGQLVNANGAAQTNADQYSKQLEYAQRLQAELDDLRAQNSQAPAATEGQMLPADALDRLIAVDGIARKLAQKALDALLKPAEAPAEEPATAIAPDAPAAAEPQP